MGLWNPGVCCDCKRSLLNLGINAPRCARCTSVRVGDALAGKRVELTSYEASLLQLNYRVRAYHERQARRAR